MANLRLTRLSLIDRFPGPDNANVGIPVDGWGTNDGTSPAYPLGEKRMAYTDNSHCPGTYTMMYGTLAGISKTNYCVSHDYSHGKCWVAHCCLTVDVSAAADPTYLMAENDGTIQPFYVMHRCTSDAVTDLSESGGAALPCATMDPYDYGWFWVGGVCPCREDLTIMEGSEILGLGADMTTDDSVTPGGVFLCFTALTTVPSGEYTACFEVSMGGDPGTCFWWRAPVGWAAGPDI